MTFRRPSTATTRAQSFLRGSIEPSEEAEEEKKRLDKAEKAETAEKERENKKEPFSIEWQVILGEKSVYNSYINSESYLSSPFSISQSSIPSRASWLIFRGRPCTNGGGGATTPNSSIFF